MGVLSCRESTQLCIHHSLSRGVTCLALALGTDLDRLMEDGSEEQRRRDEPGHTPRLSPYMTVAESASFARCHEQTIRKAVRAYQRDQTTGLKAFQSGAHATIRVHVDDLTRWIQGEPPSKGARRR